MAHYPKLTDEKKQAFLEELRASGNVAASARAVGMTRQRMYQVKADDQAFADAWEEAEADAVDALEAEARRRALDGVDEPVFYQGMKVAVIRKYSDLLLIFLLRGHRPEKYDRRAFVPAPNNDLLEKLKRLADTGLAQGETP